MVAEGIGVVGFSAVAEKLISVLSGTEGIGESPAGCGILLQPDTNEPKMSQVMIKWAKKIVFF